MIATLINGRSIGLLTLPTKSYLPLIQNVGIIAGTRNYSKHGNKSATSTIFEVIGGVGGTEAMLFASEMADLYSKYFNYKRWPYEIIEEEGVHTFKHDNRAVKSLKFSISGPDCYERLIQEAGVHRVQRVPKNSNKMHTSTVTISIVPKSVVDIKINDKDLEWTSKRSSGAGGQHVNKVETAVRLVHRPSGVAVESQESRSQIDNKKTAMKKLLSRLQETELEKITSQMSALKRSQVGNAERSEKIRTYNFPNDRITDHRIHKSYSNLRALFYDGDLTVLDKIIDDFRQET